ncbi:unnamed protein product [Caenorhabditis bovis]|uniref:Protein-lysine methyltransferase METTL21D n=1 Tax=Caenorhabditis bovis TaxID=2654633 RepID=A0A8S1EYE4_9PELO|nr:unnamed protein product [Caenorhabditis bovis]
MDVLDSSSVYPRTICFRNSENEPKELEIYQEILTDVGGVIWDSALLTIHYFFKHPDLYSGKKVLELGSGTGVCSLVLAALGAEVTATDLPERMPLLEKNIEKNKSLVENQIKAEPLDWTKNEAPNDLDLILAVDCIYYTSSIDALIEFFRKSCAKEILIVSEKRDIGEPFKAQTMFFEKIKQFFNIVAIPEEELDEDYFAEDIVIAKLVKKS